MIPFLETPTDIIKRTAADFRALRKARGITIKELSEKSGVSYSSIKRFEHTGEVSFLALTRMASVLHVEDRIRTLFDDIPPASIEEVLRGQR